MGAKVPDKLKLRRQPCNCNICGRTFLNAQALTTHRKYMHRPKTLPSKTVTVRSKQSKNVKAAIKKNSNAAEAKETVETPKETVMNKTEESTSKKDIAAKKIHFKCPSCVKTFSVYFSAFRHIQKYHCVDINGEPVPPDSKDLIQPVQAEQCVFCNQWVTQNEEHSCEGIMNHISEHYMCLGCQQTFNNLVLFEHHVKGLHGNEVEYYFFPTKDEFTSWKTVLEDTINIKYVTLTTDKQKSKQTYHCSHLPTLKSEKTLLCSSSLCVTEFKSGYQVTYYKEHFGHTCIDMPTIDHKKYLINPYLKNTEGATNAEKDDSVYQQFKSLMNCISATAAKVDIGVLNTLLGKALEMTIVLNSIMHEEHSTVNKTMTDEQISDVLAEVKTYPGKRKSESSKKDAKKMKPPIENDENAKVDNLVPNKESNKVTSKKSGESLPGTPLARPLLQSPTFNDSYKDFVDQNFTSKVPNDRSNTAKKLAIKKKIVMKTKMGQFKVKPSLSPKLPKKSPVKTIGYKIKPDVKYEVKERENDCNILILKI